LVIIYNNNQQYIGNLSEPSLTLLFARLRKQKEGNMVQESMQSTALADAGDAHSHWFGALVDGDTDTLERLLADDWTFYHPYGGFGGKADYIEAIRSRQLRYHSTNAEEPLIRLYGQTAIVTGQVDIWFSGEGEPELERLYYTAVYGWFSPGWRMLAWHATLRADEQG
jgi:ketosteroid isomerase-like protein